MEAQCKYQWARVKERIKTNNSSQKKSCFVNVCHLMGKGSLQHISSLIRMTDDPSTNLAEDFCSISCSHKVWSISSQSQHSFALYLFLQCLLILSLWRFEEC